MIHKVTQGKTNTDGLEQWQAAQTLTRQELMMGSVCVCVSAYCSEFQIGRHKDRKSAVRDGEMDCVTVCQEQEIHSASIFQDSEREGEGEREMEESRK